MRMFIGLLVLGLPMVLAACETMVIVGEPVMNLNYTVDDFEYASRNGEIRTRIGDDPFGGPHAAFSEQVTKFMYGANFGVDVVFTPSPRGKGSGRHHVVMLFNSPISTDERDLCGADARPPTLLPTNTLRLISVFCYEDEMLSTADGRIFGVENLQEPRFRDLVRQVTLALFPGNDDLEVGGDEISDQD
jgi:hypothetical protein